MHILNVYACLGEKTPGSQASVHSSASGGSRAENLEEDAASDKERNVEEMEVNEDNRKRQTQSDKQARTKKEIDSRPWYHWWL